ncbi:MAG: hypothetical protein EG828_03810 [Deltaproteobacteria bacterium]|nr:hypothetical protein [Deltaproteobacteria bacterium]
MKQNADSTDRRQTRTRIQVTLDKRNQTSANYSTIARSNGIDRKTVRIIEKNKDQLKRSSLERVFGKKAEPNGGYIHLLEWIVAMKIGKKTIVSIKNRRNTSKVAEKENKLWADFHESINDPGIVEFPDRPNFDFAVECLDMLENALEGGVYGLHSGRFGERKGAFINHLAVIALIIMVHWRDSQNPKRLKPKTLLEILKIEIEAMYRRDQKKKKTLLEELRATPPATVRWHIKRIYDSLAAFH